MNHQTLDQFLEAHGLMELWGLVVDKSLLDRVAFLRNMAAIAIEKSAVGVVTVKSAKIAIDVFMRAVDDLVMLSYCAEFEGRYYLNDDDPRLHHAQFEMRTTQVEEVVCLCRELVEYEAAMPESARGSYCVPEEIRDLLVGILLDGWTVQDQYLVQRMFECAVEMPLIHDAVLRAIAASVEVCEASRLGMVLGCLRGSDQRDIFDCLAAAWVRKMDPRVLGKLAEDWAVDLSR